ncbi:MAG: phosphoribosyl-ATP diphosphatase [Proteobacteria bacterium]|nr:phosphoribosyl-ATP diphosphatase [Pseudomonadota bacterium]
MSSTDTLNKLYQVIESRKGSDPAKSYVASLQAKGLRKIAEKVGEEAVETVVAAVARGKDDLIAESADLLFHLLVLWAETDITPDQVLAELKRREGTSGIDEKNSRKT